MDRRSFFKMGGAIGALFAPGVKAAPRAPETVDGLIAWFESTFDCVMGPPTTYFELTAPVRRVTYLGFGCVAVPEVPHARMIAAIYDGFSAALEKNPAARGTKLYWRLPQKITLEPQERIIENARVNETGGFDYEYDNSVMWKLRTRLAIPALDIATLAVLRGEGEPYLEIQV